MNTERLQRVSECEWVIEPEGRMRVPGVIYATAELVREMDENVRTQICNVAALPGIVKAACAMPDAHWGYGFPIGGVAAFDPDRGGVVSAGGVGFDISCGVRTLLTDLDLEAIEPVQERMADALFAAIPAGMGSTGSLRLNNVELDRMLSGGAKWAVAKGYGNPEDLDRIEDGGQAQDADPGEVSEIARKRQHNEMGTLGSGNHYLEVQHVAEVFQPEIADAFGLRPGQVLLSIHCGSRGLGHQIATEFSKRMVTAANTHGIPLPDRELACAPIASDEGRAYLGAMRGAINCALANRQILTHLVRQVFAQVLGPGPMPVLYDVSHNTCLLEEHDAGQGNRKRLFVHRKGATRALGPGRMELPAALRAFGQPVLIGGTMGTASYILTGMARNEALAFGSACHGAGRRLSRKQALKQWRGREVVDRLALRHILVRTQSYKGIAEEAPDAYKDVDAVVEATERAGLAGRVAKVKPLICVKG